MKNSAEASKTPDLSVMNRPDPIARPEEEPAEKQAVRYMNKVRALIAFATKSCLKESEFSQSTRQVLQQLAGTVYSRICRIESEIPSACELNPSELDKECILDEELFNAAVQLEREVEEFRGRGAKKYDLAKLRDKSAA